LSAAILHYTSLGVFMRRFLRTALVALPLLAACVSDEKITAPRVNPAVAIESTTFAPALNVNLGQMTKASQGYYFGDERVGTGAVVAQGDSVTFDYKAYLANGTLFDTSLQSGRVPLGVRLGAGRLITGVELGLVGTRVGGIRRLIMPATLGYGSEDYGPIPGNSVLIFDVNVISNVGK
jgi:FKBP-type peptidyl-prolyl cis-trans isomerase